MNGASDRYDKVVEDIITREYEVNDDLDMYGADCDGESPPYCCETMAVDYRIQKNDVIGVCMRDSSGRDPLYSLDEGAPTDFTVYQYPDTDNCNTRGVVDSFVASDSDISLQSINGFGLHAYLNITGEYNYISTVLFHIDFELLYYHS